MLISTKPCKTNLFKMQNVLNVMLTFCFCFDFITILKELTEFIQCDVTFYTCFFLLFFYSFVLVNILLVAKGFFFLQKRHYMHYYMNFKNCPLHALLLLYESLKRPQPSLLLLHKSKTSHYMHCFT